MRLFEQYRPKSFDEVVGQDKVIGKIAALRRRGLSGRVFWIAGSSGTGKTTIARLIAKEVADPISTLEIDANKLNTAMLDDIERTMRFYGIGEKSGRAYIINEAHYLKGAAFSRLLDLLESDFPDHCVWIFTTTKAGQEKLFDGNIDAAPLLSRCTDLQLSSQGLSKVFAEHARDIATREGLNGKPIESYIRLAKDCRNNLRKMLQMIDDGDMLA